MAKSEEYSRSVLGASDEVNDIYCEPCHRDGNVVLAEGYCKDCPDYLCAQCYKSHRRNRGLANHVLLYKNSMPTAPISIRTVLDICKEKCTLHSDKVIELFCETCDKLGCTICITLDHRQCKEVKHIPDIVKDLKNSQEFIAFHECIKSKSDELSEFEQKIQANATSNNDMQKLAKQELNRQRAKVNKFFDELERKIDDQIQKIDKRNKDALKAASDTLKPMKKELDQIKNEIRANKLGQNCEMFILMKKSKEKIRTLDDQFYKVQEQLTIQHYTLLPSEQIKAMMRSVTEICTILTATTIAEVSRISTAGTTSEVSRTPTATTTSEVSRTPTATTTTEVSRTPTATTTTEVSRTPTATTTSEVSRTPTATTTSEVSRTPTATTTSEVSRTPIATTTSEVSRTPTATTTSEVSRTPTATATTNTEVSRTPTATTTSDVSRTPTATTTSEVSRTPTATTTSEVSRTPTATTTSEVSRTPTATTTTEVGRIPATKTTAEICKASLQAVIDIKTSKDKTEPSISGLTIMHGHYCVVSDNGNKSVKVVNTKSKQVTSEIGIKSEFVWGVTSVSDDKVAVSVFFIKF